MSRLLRSAAVAAVGAVGAALLSVAPAAADNGDGRVAVSDAQPSWARSQPAQALAPAGQQMDFTLYLGWRDAKGLDAFIADVSDPRSPDYGHYLTPARFRARYAPTSAQVAKVTKFLTSNGLRVTAVPDNHSYVEATGTVAAVQRAFATRLGLFRHNGRLLRAPATQVSLPRAVASLVAGVDGLTQDGVKMHPLDQAPPPAGFRNAPPCSAYYGQKVDKTDPPLPGYKGGPLPYAPCGYTPRQLEGAYGIAGTVARGVDGRGVRVAVVDAFASPTLYQDAARYAERHGPAPLRRAQYSQIVFPPTTSLEGPDQCDASDWYSEQALDVEAVHAMAPGAHILYVGASDCLDASLNKAVNRIVDQHLADIVTNSYGSLGTEVPSPPTLLWAEHRVFQQAAAEGISMLFSSGDEGDSSTVTPDGSATVIHPAADPLVTAVGGTTLGVTRSDGYGFETAWATGKLTLKNGQWTPDWPGDFLYGSGGGTSRIWAEPSYQRGVVPASISGRYGGRNRAVPDISMVGDPNTGMLIGLTQTFPDGTYYSEYRIGGTSLSSPLFAGVLAVATQLGHHRIGFANPAIYRLAGTSALRDVTGKGVTTGDIRVDYVNGVDGSGGTVVSARTFDRTQSIFLRPGYDDVTGVGTPRGTTFLYAIGGGR